MSQIQYTDYVGLMMSSVTKIINTITYVLIAFVAISLIVSSIMIGVITLISYRNAPKKLGFSVRLVHQNEMFPVCLMRKPLLLGLLLVC